MAKPDRRDDDMHLRYRALFEENPVSIWEEDFSRVGEWFDKLRARGVRDLAAFLQEQPGRVREAASLVTITQANQAALSLLQLESKDQIVGNFGRIFKEETSDIFLAELLTIWEGRHRFTLEGSGRTAAGHPYDYVLNMLIPEEGGRPRLEAVIVVIMDVTALKDAERARQNALLEKEAILGAIPDVILTVGTDMRLKEKNRSLTALCPNAGDILPGELFEPHGGLDGCPCTEMVRRALDTRQPVRDFKAQCHRGERPRSLELSGSPLLDDEGNFVGVVVVGRDVTRMESLEQLARGGTGRQGLGSLVGRSPAMQRVYDLIQQVAGVDSTVLVTGESGTGKELVAEAIHYQGRRAGRRLVKVNCSALSENLLESELFGHVRGSFSGAVADKAGRFQLAEKGTLFLDEIGDISQLIQLKLLRFLESKEFERVGDATPLKADVRIVAATNAHLPEKVADGAFREDLFYRLQVVNIRIPPLRERKEDIPLLVRHFIEIFRADMDKDVRGAGQEVLALLMRHDWPGNVRQLRHALEHACILCPGGEELRPEHLPEGLGGPTAPGAGNGAGAPAHPSAQGAGQGAAEARRRVAALDADTLRKALERAGNNRVRAARELGISRASLYRKLNELGVH
jgi:transcriptional regulator with PAS, ATPase and Fis domain